MPDLRQGNIFDAASRIDLLVVFGHLGFNELRWHWEEFSRRNLSPGEIDDPFGRNEGRPIRWSEGRWLWFVANPGNAGMTDLQLRNVLDEIFNWAAVNRLSSIAMNGVGSAEINCCESDRLTQDEQRVRLIQDLCAQAEQDHGFAIELISANDVFVRGVR